MVRVLETEFCNGQVNHTMLIRSQAMPLHQNIEGRHNERDPHSKVICPLMMLVLQMADCRQHRQDRFNQHARVPGAALTDLHVGRIARAAMESAIDQDDHLLSKLSNQGSKILVRDTRPITLPGHEQAQMIQDKTEFCPDNPAQIRRAFGAQLLWAAPFAPGMNQFHPVTVRDAQQTGVGQKALGPQAMRRQQPKQARPLGQAWKQHPVITLQPALEGAFTDAFQSKQETDRHQFTGEQGGLRMLFNPQHGVIDLAKQFCDKVYGSHRALLALGRLPIAWMSPMTLSN